MTECQHTFGRFFHLWLFTKNHPFKRPLRYDYFARDELRMTIRSQSKLVTHLITKKLPLSHNPYERLQREQVSQFSL